MNKAFILGNVTRDPEMRYTPNGQGVTSFGVATNRRWKDKAGAIQEDTQFHEVVAWGALAETVSKILRKGVKVAVMGRLQTNSWQAQDGSKRSRTEIVMEDFVPLTPKGTDVPQTEPDSGPAASPAPENPTSKKPEKKSTKSEPSEDLLGDDDINLDDIPF